MTPHPDNRFVDEFCHWWAFFLAISAATFHLCKKFTICQSHKLPHIFTIYIFRNTPFRGNLPKGALVCWDLPTNEWLRLQTRLFSYDPETPPRAKHRYHNFFNKKNSGMKRYTVFLHAVKICLDCCCKDLFMVVFSLLIVRSVRTSVISMNLWSTYSWTVEHLMRMSRSSWKPGMQGNMFCPPHPPQVVLVFSCFTPDHSFLFQAM